MFPDGVPVQVGDGAASSEVIIEDSIATNPQRHGVHVCACPCRSLPSPQNLVRAMASTHWPLLLFWDTESLGRVG